MPAKVGNYIKKTGWVLALNPIVFQLKKEVINSYKIAATFLHTNSKKRSSISVKGSDVLESMSI